MGLWTPEHIDTALWLDAADSETLTLDGSSNVEQWADKSGNDRHAAQSNASVRPAPGTLDSYDAVDFAGSAKRLIVPRGFITSAISIFAVYGGGSGKNQRIIDQRSTGASGAVKGWQFKNHNTSLADVDVFDDGAGNIRQVSNLTLSGRNMRCTLFPVSGNVECYVNGSSSGTPSGSGAVPADFDNTGLDIAIGGNADGSATQDYDGKICEIVLFSSVVDTSTRQYLEGYLAHKWGLSSSLPSGHPFKSAAPTRYTISGIIRDENNDPCQRAVYAMSRPTDGSAPQVLSHGLSDETTGAYELIVPNDAEVTRIVIAEDSGTPGPTDPVLPDLVDRVIPG